MQFIDIAKLVENMKILKGKEIIVWGAGNMGKYINEVLPVKIKYYVDSDKDKEGKYIGNIPICNYKKLYDESIETVVVIIGTTVKRVFIEIRDILVGMGMAENKNFIDGYIFYELYLTSIDEEYDKSFRKFYWESRVEDLMEHNQKYTNELTIIRKVMESYKPQNLLEVGIGSGRFLHIYKKYGVHNVIGQDIADKGLKICKKNFPEYTFINTEIEDLQFEYDKFDVCIVNRVLSAIPKKTIGKVLDNICKISKVVMINEYSENEFSGNSSYWFLHEELIKRILDRDFFIKEEYELDYEGNMDTNGKTKAYVLEKQK